MIRLFVLGILNQKTMHGYELYQQLERSRIDLWSDVLPGSIYHALRQMDKEGLVRIRGTEQTGNKTRAIYEITEQGKETLQQLILETLMIPSTKFPASFYAALFLMDEMPTEQILSAIDKQITELEQKIELWQQGEAKKIEATKKTNLIQFIFANGIDHMQTDLTLLHELKEELENSV